MKLQHKHLAFYLPYDLKVLYLDEYNSENTSFLVGLENQKAGNIAILKNKYHYQIDCGLEYIMPILVPLSDLGKYENFTGNNDVRFSKKFKEFRDDLFQLFDFDYDGFDWLITMIMYENDLNNDWTLKQIIELNQILAEYHIDVFNLVPNKIATSRCL